MPDFTGGYTSAVDSAARREYEGAITDEVRQTIKRRQEDEDQYKKTAMASIIGILSQADAGIPQPPIGPQPMPPGESSQPMMKPPSPFGPPAGPPNAGPPPTLGAKMMAPPPPMPSPMVPPAPGMMPPAAMGAMGGGAPPTLQMDPPIPQKPGGMMPIPGGPFGGPAGGGQPPPGLSPSGAATPVGPPPMGPPGDEASIKAPPTGWVKKATDAWSKAGIDPVTQFEALEKMRPIIHQQEQAAFEAARVAAAGERAKSDAIRAETARIIAERGPKPTAAMQNATFAEGGNVPAARADVKKQVEKAGTFAPARGRSGKGGAGAGAIAGGPGAWDQETIRFYAAMNLAGDQSWRVGLSRTTGGSQNISKVDEATKDLAKEAGISPTEVGTIKAKRAALTYSMRQQQNALSQAEAFISNFNKQADLVEKYLKPGAAGSVPIINKWIQAGRKSVTGDPDVTAFDTAVRGLSREHQRIVTGLTSNAQLHAASQQTADELLNKDMTAEQIRSTLGVMREEAGNLIDSRKEQVTSLQDQMSSITAGKGGSEKPASGGDISSKVKAAGISYEPDKYDYRINDQGEVQRKPK